MRKKLFFGFIMLLLTAGIPLTLIAVKNQQDTRSRASTEAVKFFFNPNEALNSAPGSEVPLTLRMNTNGNPVAAMDVTLIYDKAKLELVSVDDSNSNFGANIHSNTPNNTTGEIRYAATAKDNNPITGAEVDIATFKFKTKPITGDANGAQVGLSSLKVATSGQVNTELSANFDIARITITTTNQPPGNKPLVCEYYGDVNEDNVLSGEDAVLILQIATGGTFTVAQKSNADLDNNGKVEIADSLMLRRYLEGLETTFPVCNNHPVCTNPNSFNSTVLGCEQCLACGSLTWCENMLQGNVGGPRMSGCVNSTNNNCQSRGGTPRTTCPTELTDNPVCVSLTPSVTSGQPPLSVGFTGVGKNDFGTIYRMKIDWGDGTPGSDMSYGGVVGSTVTRQFDPHSYTTPGIYTAKLTVYGNDNSHSVTSPACQATITVGSVPTRTPTPTPTRTPTPTPTASPTPTSVPLVCNNDNDNDIDTDDYNVWLNEFKNGTGTRSDCDGTEGVSIFDYAKWLGEYRKYVTANNP